MKLQLNMIGQQVKNVRDQLGWSHKFLAARLQLSGWDIFHSSLSEIKDSAVNAQAPAQNERRNV